MTIRLLAFGQLQDYFGEKPRYIELPEGSTLRDLMATISERWGTSLPDFLWDSQRGRFRGPVVIMIEKRAVRDPETALENVQEVQLHKVLVGG